MKGINKAIIVGTLGKDPEMRAFPDGGCVTNFSVATSESWNDRQSGERKEKTEWHNIVARDRGNFHLAQICNEFLSKGSKVYIEGKIQTRKWQDREGNDRYTTEIVAWEVQFLGGPRENPGSKPGPKPQEEYMPPQEQTTSAPGDFAGDFDDDIPF